MAPKRRRGEAAATGGEVKPTVEVSPLRRVTRSLTREDAVPPKPQAVSTKKRVRKAKATPKESKATTEEDSAADEEQDDADVITKKVAKLDVGSSSGSSAKATIIIEHCKQCNSFKNKAAQVQAALKESASGVKVLINPEKPRKGCFEIRTEGGKIIITLQDLKRPFNPMKKLVVKEVVADIMGKIQA